MQLHTLAPCHRGCSMRHVLLCSILLAMSAGSACRRADDSAAITVEGRSLSIEDIVQDLERLQGDSAAVTAYAEACRDRLLILEDACRRGLDSDPEVESAMYDEARSRLQYIYLQYKVGLVPVPEDTILSFYAGMGEMLVYTAIQSDDSLTADSLRALVEGGADARVLAAANTVIQQDRATGGRCGPSDRMRLVGDDRILLAGLSQGDLSPIIHSPAGWRFLLLDSVYRVGVPPLDSVRTQIRDFIWAHLSEEYRHTLDDSLVEAYHLSINPLAPGIISSHALDPLGTFSPYSDSEAGMAAYTWDGGERTIISLACCIRNMPGQMPRQAGDSTWVADFCSLMGLYDIMAARAVELGLGERPDVSRDIRIAREGILLEAWYDAVVRPRLAVSEQELMDTWNSNRDMLIHPERRVFRLVYAAPGGQVEMLGSLLASGGDPFSHLDDLTVPAAIMADADAALTRPLEAGDIPEDAREAAFSLAEGGSLACSLSQGGMLYLELEEILPVTEATFEESRATLEQLISEDRQEEVVAGLVDSLRSAYAWNVRWDLFSRFFEGNASIQDQPGVD